MTEIKSDPCSRCPLLQGKDISAEQKTPCQDQDGLFLGTLMISPFACKYANKGGNK